VLPFLESRFKNKPKTLEYYKNGTKNLTGFLPLAISTLDTITDGKIAAFVTKRREAGLQKPGRLPFSIPTICKRACRCATITTADSPTQGGLGVLLYGSPPEIQLLAGELDDSGLEIVRIGEHFLANA